MAPFTGDTPLVTGIAGFVGSSLGEALASRGDLEIVGIDSFTDYYDTRIKLKNIEKIEQMGVRTVRDDLMNADLAELLRGVDTVFHQAGQPGVRPSWGSSFHAYTHANVEATQRLLEFCKTSSDIERVVYASSSSVYGNATSYPTAEKDLPRPLSPYGVTKLAGEHLMSLYAENFGVPAVSLRYFTVYGPRQRPDMAFSKFISKAINNEPIQIYGDGSQIRDFTYVDDVVSANIAAATAPLIQSGVAMNICGGSSITVLQTLEILQSEMDSALKLEYCEKMAGDVYQTGGTADLAQATLGWVPKVPVETGLKAQINWMKELK